MAETKKIALQGLKGLVLHPITENTDEAYTVGEAIKLPGAQTLSKEVQSESESIYADDEIYDVVTDVKGEQLTISLVEMAPEIIAKINGSDYVEENNKIIYKTSDIPPEFCLSYQAANRSGGARAFRNHVVKLVSVNVSHETKGASAQIAPYELVLMGSARKIDSAYREQADFDTPAEAATWCQTVPNLPDADAGA